MLDCVRQQLGPFGWALLFIRHGIVRCAPSLGLESVPQG
jgi:hypothetical protein